MGLDRTTKLFIFAFVVVPVAVFYGDRDLNQSQLFNNAELKFQIVNYHAKNMDPDRALLDASQLGQEGLVDYLVDVEKANVTAKENAYKGNGAIHWGARVGSVRICKKLVDAGCPIDIRDTQFDNIGNTALMLASDRGFHDLAQYLIDSGADVDSKEFGPPATDASNTPLHLAARAGSEPIIAMLIEGKAEVDYAGSGGWSALTYAAHKGFVGIGKRLLDAGAKVDWEDWYYNTPLHWAAKEGHTEFVAMLLEAGADVTIESKEMKTALKDAKDSGHDAVAELLKEKTEAAVAKKKEERARKRAGLK